MLNTASPLQREIYARAYTQRADDDPSPYAFLSQYSDDFTRWAMEMLPRGSFLNWDGPAEEWRRQGLTMLAEMLGPMPPSAPLAPETMSVAEHDGLRIETIRYKLTYGPPTEGLLLTPIGQSGPLPGVVALHDHGAFKYYGKEKITEQPDDESRPALVEFRDCCYGGRAWANALARRGFAVFVPDVFPWGSRKFEPAELGSAARDELNKFAPGSAEYINAFNNWNCSTEQNIFKALLASGRTFAGVVLHEDLRAVDYLATRPEVDATRLGCGGLSGGGLRTIFLAGSDERIKCAFCAGFMPTMQSLVPDFVTMHTMQAFPKYMGSLLDFPDILALRAPLPTFVLQCNDDPLYTRSGMHAADRVLAETYKKMGAEENYLCKFYPGPHQLTPPMQDDAFDWLGRFLK